MKKRNGEISYLILSIPSMLIFTLVLMVPFFQGIYYSFTNWGKTIGRVDFIGLENYEEVIADETFWYSFLLTIIFSIASVILINLVAFGLAIIVSKKIRGVAFFRAGFFLPNLIGGLILGYIWQFIFNGFFYEMFGSSPLSDPNSAVIALIFVLAWQYAGYIMMIYVTAILSIPDEVIEASVIDGTNSFKQWIFVKVPMIAGAFVITLFLTITNSFKQFDVIFSLTSGGPARTLADGSVVNGTQTLAVDIYSRAFQLKDMSEAQAEAIIFFVVLAIIAIVQVLITKRKEVEA